MVISINEISHRAIILRVADMLQGKLRHIGVAHHNESRVQDGLDKIICLLGTVVSQQSRSESSGVAGVILARIF